MPPVEGEQFRNLMLLRRIGLALLIGLLFLGGALYFGYELPPTDLRTYFTSASGYAAPPRSAVAPPGSVARGSLELYGPAEAREPRPDPAAVPPAAAAWKNPLAPQPAVLALGRRTYAVQCAMCHGEPRGPVGPVGERYAPRPPVLAERVPGLSPGHLYHVITRGIASRATPEAAAILPVEWHAFRATTSRRERWAIVTYLESLPAGGGTP